MDHRNSFRAVLCVILLAVLALPPTAFADSPDPERHDEGFHFYIAVGGCVAGGLYLLISYSSGLLDYDPMVRSALINYGPGGWKAGMPMVHMVERGAGAGDYYLEVLTVRFE